MTRGLLYAWWVDGHYILAHSATESREVACRLYDYQPRVVRRWNSGDNG